jgi:thymidine kinase
LEIIKQLGGKCNKCGINDIRVLDINHLDPTKKTKYKNKMQTTARRLKDWAKNIKHLELLCANCHRIHTWKQMKYGKGLKI